MTDQPQLDPVAVIDAVNAVLRLVAMLGGGGLATVVVGYVGKRWFDERRRASGDDPEHSAKVETREQIKAQGTMLAAASASLENTARIQQRMLDELSVMRRESYEAHADIKALVKGGAS